MRAARTVIGLTLLLISSLAQAAEDPLFGSYPPSTPKSLEGTQWFRLSEPGGPVVLEWESPSTKVLDDPEVLLVQDTPVGHVWFAADPLVAGSWNVFDLNLNPLFRVDWDPMGGSHIITGIPGLTGRIDDEPVAMEQLDDGSTVWFSPITEGGPWIGVMMGYSPSSTDGQVVQFLQFSTSCLTWEGIHLATNTPISGAPGPGTLVPTTGNGGHGVNVSCDTTYIDGEGPGLPHYPPWTHEGMTYMTDEPGVPDTLALLTKAGVPPPGVKLTKAWMITDYDTYLLVDGQVIFHWEWSFYVELPQKAAPGVPLFGGPGVGPGTGPGVPNAGPIEDLEPGHQDALDKFMDEDYTGSTL
jgi:hypothetical protein